MNDYIFSYLLPVRGKNRLVGVLESPKAIAMLWLIKLCLL